MHGYNALIALGAVAFKGGGSSGSSSGGGSQGSGAVSWPSYLQSAHDKAMRHGSIAADGGDVDMLAAVQESWDSSPYENAFAYDPTDDVAAMQARYGEFQTLIDTLVPATQWGDYVDVSAAKFDEQFDDTYIAGLVTAFEEREQAALDRRIGRFAAGMADGNAVAGSAFVMGMAMLNQDSKNEVSRLDRELTAQHAKDRLAFAMQGASELRAHLSQQLQIQQAATHLKGELLRIGIVAKGEYVSKDVELAVQDRTWNLNVWQPYANLMAAVSGGTSAGGSTTKGHDGSSPGSMIGGAITGGIGGAMAGAPLGPWGMVAGGLLGAFGGSQG